MNARAAKLIRRLAVKKDPERKIPGLIPALKLAYYSMPRRHPGWKRHREYAPVIWVRKPRARAVQGVDPNPFRSYGASRADVRGRIDMAVITKHAMTKDWQESRRKRRSS